MRYLFLTFQLLLVIFHVGARTPEEWMKKGEAAEATGNYREAVEAYKNAAVSGSPEGCGALAFMYYNYVADGTRNTEMASLWAKRAGTIHSNYDADIVLALIAYYDGDFDTTIKILRDWKPEALISEAKLALAISYLFHKDSLSADDKTKTAENLLKQAYSKTKNQPGNFYYSTSAVLALLELEKKYDINNPKIYDYLEDFGMLGEEGYVYCPLAEYVSGLILCLIDDEESQEIGLTKIEVASEHDYETSYTVLYPFAGEIIETYNRIK